MTLDYIWFMKEKKPIKKETFTYRADPKIVEKAKDKLEKVKDRKKRITLSEKIAIWIYDFISE